MAALPETYTGSASTPFRWAPVLQHGVKTHTCTGAETLTRKHARLLALDPGGASRDVTLPVGKDGDFFAIYNAADAAEDLVIYNPSAVALATLAKGSTGAFICVAGTWAVLMAGATSAASMTTDVIAESTPAAGVTIDGLLLKDGKVDLNGVAGGLILDAAGTTTIDSDTDAQIDITVAAAIDFRIVANIFRAMSGSVIETNTINETTAANGVAIDGLTIKDASVRPTAHADPGNAGAIPVTSSGQCALTSAGAETRTLAIPTFAGQRLLLHCDVYVGNIVVTSAQAINQTGNTIMTFGAARDNCELVGITVGGALRWQVAYNDGVALS
jgi:hypothetical protein